MAYPKTFGYFSRFEQQMPEHLVILGCGFRNPRNRLLWNDQHVYRCLRFDGSERKHQVVFITIVAGISRALIFSKRVLVMGLKLRVIRRTRQLKPVWTIPLAHSVDLNPG